MMTMMHPDMLGLLEDRKWGYSTRDIAQPAQAHVRENLEVQ